MPCQKGFVIARASIDERRLSSPTTKRLGTHQLARIRALMQTCA